MTFKAIPHIHQNQTEKKNALKPISTFTYKPKPNRKHKQIGFYFLGFGGRISANMTF